MKFEDFSLEIKGIMQILTSGSFRIFASTIFQLKRSGCDTALIGITREPLVVIDLRLQLVQFMSFELCSINSILRL